LPLVPAYLGFISGVSSAELSDPQKLHAVRKKIFLNGALFVLGLLIYVIVRYKANRNPVPTRTAHNTVLEVLWTVIPVLILVFIAIPSFRLLYYEDTVPDAEMTLKVTGHQWYWSYEYPDHGLKFDSLIKCRTQEECDAAAQEGETPLRLLDVDNPVVVPVGATVRVQLTAEDVIHSWAVPSLGIKTDTVPGRLNETWMRVDREGVHYGHCYELCGIDHGFMPIAVKAVSREAFDEWVKQIQRASAREPASEPLREVAGAELR
jgi:cytochrome c oxidase subunit 2